MAYEIKPGQGSLWANENKTSDNAPNATGRCNIDGKIFKIAAWTNESKDGKRFMSLKIEIDEKPKRAEGQSTADYIDDEIPF